MTSSKNLCWCKHEKFYRKSFYWAPVSRCNHKKQNRFVSVSNEMLLCWWQIYQMRWGNAIRAIDIIIIAEKRITALSSATLLTTKISSSRLFSHPELGSVYILQFQRRILWATITRTISFTSNCFIKLSVWRWTSVTVGTKMFFNKQLNNSIVCIFSTQHIN